MATKKAPENSEYEVWYDHRDGHRRLLRATTKEAVRTAIHSIEADEERVRGLARTVGLDAGEHDLNIEVLKTTVTKEAV